MLGQTEQAIQEQQVQIDIGKVVLQGGLAKPRNSAGIVVFAHGSGSGRHSPRNQFVAHALQQAGLATLLFDLLTSQEEEVDVRTGHIRFDIPLLAERLGSVGEWLRQQPETHDMSLGYFGASTGAAAALVAAAENPSVRAVVSRGGRPDLAGDALERVQAPTLLIVGGEDVPVIALNRQAMSRLSTPQRQLVIVPGASHLFEEPGALEQVAQLAADWFRRFLATTSGANPNVEIRNKFQSPKQGMS